MDIAALIADLTLVLNMLPPDLVRNIVGSIVQHIPTLAKEWPTIVKIMRPHIMAGMVAHGAGALDEAELTKACMELFQDYFKRNPPTQG